MATQLPQQEGGKAERASLPLSIFMPCTSIIQIRINLESNKEAGLSVCVLPVCPCRGECGRGRVGDVLEVTIRLFLLLVRQLKGQKRSVTMEMPC